MFILKLSLIWDNFYIFFVKNQIILDYDDQGFGVIYGENVRLEILF